MESWILNFEFWILFLLWAFISQIPVSICSGCFGLRFAAAPIKSVGATPSHPAALQQQNKTRQTRLLIPVHQQQISHQQLIK
ncbi:MAG: hypothetical protein K2X48_06895 [Chitinophagaceae bacterium]|nr:hypothetical protein [Chitinophagaceae bacterium]